MAFTSRASRTNPSLVSLSTPPLAAPGRYEVRQPYRHVPNYTAFGSSDGRKLDQAASSIGPLLSASSASSVRRIKVLPGPGTYTLDRSFDLPLASDFGAASFSSTAPRLAPSAAGASAFAEPSSVNNPGPGAYREETCVDRANKQGRRDKLVRDGNEKAGRAKNRVMEIMQGGGPANKAASAPATAEGGGHGYSPSSAPPATQQQQQQQSYIPRPMFNPPAIPQKFQTFGYITVDSAPPPYDSSSSSGNTNSNNNSTFQPTRSVSVLPVPPPSQIITGLKGDSVGPGAYDISSPNALRLSSHAPIPYAFCKTSRTIFSPSNLYDNTMPSKDNPGPGEYDPGGCGAANAGDKEWTKGGAASSFRSNCKMAHQIGGGSAATTTTTTGGGGGGKTSSEQALINSKNDRYDGLLKLALEASSSAGLGAQSSSAAAAAFPPARVPARHFEIGQNVDRGGAFGSTARRDTVPKVHADASAFAPSKGTDGYMGRAVGPGTYSIPSAFDYNLSKVRNRKTLKEEGAGAVGFGATAERPCLMETKKEEQTSDDNDDDDDYAAAAAAAADVSDFVGSTTERKGVIGTNPAYGTLAHSVKSRVVGRNGVFGTTGSRFRSRDGNDVVDHGYADGSKRGEGTDLNVGPGTYEPNRNAYGEPTGSMVTPEYRGRKKLFTSNFKSANNRFEPMLDGKTGGFIVFGEKRGVGGQADLLQQQLQSGLVVGVPPPPPPMSSGGSVASGVSKEHQPVAPPPQRGDVDSVLAGVFFVTERFEDEIVAPDRVAKTAAFGRSEKRGGDDKNIDGSKFSENPGPQYLSKVNNLYAPPKMRVVGRERNPEPQTFGRDARLLHARGNMSESLGPGAYTLPSSINTKSFNVTFKAKNTQYLRQRRAGGAGGGGSSGSFVGSSDREEPFPATLTLNASEIKFEDRSSSLRADTGSGGSRGGGGREGKRGGGSRGGGGGEGQAEARDE